MSEITIGQITDGLLGGNGSFDVLMAAITAHIDQQYEKNRITSSDFGAVYLGSIQTTLEQAINFTLSSGKVELEEKILQTQLEKLELEKQLTALQVERAETENQTAQVMLQKAQKELAQLDLQSALIAAQTAKTNTETNLTQQQVNHTAQEIELVKQKLTTEKAQTNDGYAGIVGKQSALIAAQTAKTTTETDLTQQQVNRTVQEIELVKQKLTTEKAQTSDGYAGVVGKQVALYSAQANGFTRDSEQKAAKLVLDIVATQMTQNDEYTVQGTNLHATAIGAFVNKLATGIGVTIPPAP